MASNSLPVENDKAASLFHNGHMAGKSGRAKRGGFAEAPQAAFDDEKIRLAEWMARAGVKAAEVAREAAVNPSFISMLTQPEKYPKKEPSVPVVRRIARFFSLKLGYPVTVDDLYEFPPSDADIRRARGMAERLARR